MYGARHGEQWLDEFISDFVVRSRLGSEADNFERISQYRLCQKMEYSPAINKERKFIHVLSLF